MVRKWQMTVFFQSHINCKHLFVLIELYTAICASIVLHIYTGYLRPSRDLLEYYRKKIAEYDEEHEGLVSKLDEYKMTYEEQVCVTLKHTW